MNAETAYCFRHALLRDVAYLLQMPGDRRRRHGLAFAVIEEAAGGRAPEAGAHPTDAVAEELAAHAGGAEQPVLRKLYLGRAARHADAKYRHDAAEQLWREHADVSAGTERGESLGNAASAAVHAGRPRVAAALYEDALALHHSTGHPMREASALGQLGLVLMDLGDIDGGRRRFEEAMAIQRAQGDLLAETATRNGIAILLRTTGRVAEAEALLLEVRAAHRASGNRALEAASLANLASVYQETGRTEPALAAITEALGVFLDTGDRRAAGIAYGNLAIMHSTAGRAAEAERAFRSALAIHRETGNRRSEGVVLMNLGSHLTNTSRTAEAERVLLESLAIHRETDNGRVLGAALGNVGQLQLEAGKKEEGLASIEEALALHRRFQNPRSEGHALCARAVFFVRDGQLEAAREDWRRGTELLRAVADAGGLKRKEEAMREACAASGVEPSSVEC